MKLIPKRVVQSFERQQETGWLDRVLSAPAEISTTDDKLQRTEDVRWYVGQTASLIDQIRQTASDYMPWLLPDYQALRTSPALGIEPRAQNVPLLRLPEYIKDLQAKVRALLNQGNTSESPVLLEQLGLQLADAHRNSLLLMNDIRQVIARSETLIREMDFSFLLDKRRKLLSIGSDGETGKVHAACYDLLASEARIASFLAIAKGEIPQESWFMMGRAHVVDQGRPLLISWTGTMFEYLMPALWMRAYPETMLQRTQELAVLAQQSYANEKRIPWGISESGYAKIEESGNYSYRAFGVPHLAVNHEEEERPVVSPYSTMLALSVAPAAAIKNLRWMAKKGWFGRYGFYESVDYSPETRPKGQRYAIVRSWMAHHQGMSLLAIANFLQGGVVQNWFHRDPRVQATELLLQERPVRYVPPAPKKRRGKSGTSGRKETAAA
jgi:hypothetical protein